MMEFWNVYNKEEAAKKLKDLLESPNWQDCFCVDNDGNKIKYSESDENAVRDAGVSGEGQTCFDEATALTLIKQTIAANAQEIAEWLLSKSYIKRMECHRKTPIGYVVNENGEKTETGKFLFVLEKDHNDVTKYGFFVGGVIPIL